MRVSLLLGPSAQDMNRWSCSEITHPNFLTVQAVKLILAYRPAAGGAVTSVRFQVAKISSVY